MPARIQNYTVCGSFSLLGLNRIIIATIKKVVQGRRMGNLQYNININPACTIKSKRRQNVKREREKKKRKVSAYENSIILAKSLK